MSVLYGIAAVAAGVLVLWAAREQWHGRAGIDFYPFVYLARIYLWGPTGGVGFILVGISLILHGIWPDTLEVATVLVLIAMGLLVVMIVLLCLPLERVRPEWQRRQVAWMDAEEAAGRNPRWTQRPDELRSDSSARWRDHLRDRREERRAAGGRRASDDLRWYDDPDEDEDRG